jgi:hypothetical protein
MMAATSDGSDTESVNPLEDLVLDVKVPGRVGLSRPVANDDEMFSFGSFPPSSLTALPTQLLEDCKRAFNATTVDDAKDDEAAENGVSSGETYWVSAMRSDEKNHKVVRCGLEKLAAEIFDFHVGRMGLESGVDFDPSKSGAEWWTQYIEGDAEIGFHFDKDFTTEEETGLDLFPHLATVTYLTGDDEKSYQAPTLILQHSIDPARLSEEEHDEDDDETRVGFPSQYASGGDGIRRAWLSSPAPGKHICFNGRHLHGAVDVLARCFDGPRNIGDAGGGGGGSSSSSSSSSASSSSSSSSSSSVAAPEARNAKRQKVAASGTLLEEDGPSPRVTFLVNLWFNWKPLGCDPLTDEAAGSMMLDVKGSEVSFQKPEQIVQLPTFEWPRAPPVGQKPKRKGKAASKSKSKSKSQAVPQSTMRRRFNQRGRCHMLTVPLPPDIPDDDDDSSGSEDDSSEKDEPDASVPPWALNAGDSVEISFVDVPASVVCLEDGEEESDDDEDDDGVEGEEGGGSIDMAKLALIRSLLVSMTGSTASKRKRAQKEVLGIIAEGDLDEVAVEECRLAAAKTISELTADTSEHAGANDDSAAADEDEDGNASESGGAQQEFENVD